jgi:predicted nucleic acid-binding protein
VKLLVADASFCGAWVLQDEHSEAAEGTLRSLLGGKAGLAVPCLWHFEMLNLLRSAVRRKRLPQDAAQGALALLDQIPIARVDMPGIAVRARILELSISHQLSAYDAAYLELADRLHAPLLTGDRALAQVAVALGVTVPGE